ncbi:MAG TPA: F0F1 ATP synthase subunit A, partial [Rhodothermales bacterium]
LVPFGVTATSNLMITAVLATITFLITQFSASKDHWLHVLWPPGVPAFVKPILIPVEILGLFTKPFALAIRLFANMTAGHLVILSLIGLIFSFAQMFGDSFGYGVAPVSVAFSLFIYLLEILVAFIQAYIFTMLSALFIGMAVAEHGHEHEHEYTEGVLPDYTAENHSEVTPHPLRPKAALGHGH